MGPRAIASLEVGDFVYSVEGEAIVTVPLVKVGKQRVSAHRVVRLELDDDTVLEISPGHPTADGRELGELRPGDMLDGRAVRSAGLIDYAHQFTHDILPASTSGAYFAAGVLMGSTLAPGGPATVATR